MRSQALEVGLLLRGPPRRRAQCVEALRISPTSSGGTRVGLLVVAARDPDQAGFERVVVRALLEVAQLFEQLTDVVGDEALLRQPAESSRSPPRERPNRRGASSRAGPRTGGTPRCVRSWTSASRCFQLFEAADLSLRRTLSERRDPGPPRWSVNSRPPVRPVGPQDQDERHQRPDARRSGCRPGGRATARRHVDAVLGLRQERVDRADRQRSDDSAPEARRAADHEHRKGDEGQIEVERLGVQGQQVDVEPAREPRERAREREGDQPLPVDRDADRAGGGGVLPRRP